tara:strand:- start:197 stop:745 length:549 start_codon:yes stop_codon:yes gene_type:complete
MKKFDDINQIEYSELKQIFEDYLKNNPEMLNSLTENFYKNYKSKYPDFVIDEDETVYPYQIADWAYDEIGPDAYNSNKDNAKPFYKMAGDFYETYHDLLWVLSDIIVKYKDHDSSFISESAELSGWFIEPSDELGDDSIIGGDHLAEKEDYDDLGIQININDFNNLSELCNAIKGRMKKGDY